MPPQSTQLPLVEETWLPVVGYEGLYEVSDLGRVRRTARGKRTYPGRILKNRPSNGYLDIVLFRNGQRKEYRVHRLVAEAFLGPAAGREVNHKDGVKAHNRPGNLEWASRGQNVRHAVAMGLLVPVGLRGEDSPVAKLSEADVLAIRATRGSMTQQELAHQYGVSRAVIGDVQRRKTWKHI